MAKKRNRKKKKRIQVEQAVSMQQPESLPVYDSQPIGRGIKAVIILIVVVTLLAVYSMLRGHNGDISNAPSNTQSSSNSSTGGQGGSQPLSPSGSVDLQPTSSAAQAGSIQ